ncbi:zinc-binding oxidoreductase-like protein ToxD [Ophiobolus disseminans]|uniref:Zinc-binding oxidoreductase-like protein ToxD n=1 Tax=Ophiobolus disseminans TaxID=1469910 RepID=A0A6A6ZVQ2_9PLEO|nr:zinc-binding oxidoreductase-like protein ToxD [Ophiobolus disseminans]
MKEAIIHKGPRVEVIDSEIPMPGPNQLVIKVAVSGCNPKDWKLPELIPTAENQGDDMAGIVHSVGEGVYEFKPGDRVASFHEVMSKNGTYAEYAIGWQHTTFHIPDSVSFEDASTIPLAAITAAIGIHWQLRLPLPWLPATESTPLLIYGGASAVGAFAIKLAVRANIHPIIAVAGRGADYVESLIDRSKGDAVVDYRNEPSAIVSGIKEALKGAELHYAFDAIADHGSWTNIVQALHPKGKITLVTPGVVYDDIPKSMEQSTTSALDAHRSAQDFAFVFYRYISKGLADDWFKAHPVEVVPGGLEGVEKALLNLKEGKASGLKYAVRVS